MNGPTLTFPVKATHKLSCTSLRLATIALATPTLMMAAMIHHKNASTSKLKEQPLMPKVAHDPLSGGTRLPLQTRPLEVTLECVGPR